MAPAIDKNPGKSVFANANNNSDVDTGEQLIAGVVNTSDQHKDANISANFLKNPKLPEQDTQGLGGN
jgi:hypothetical protein